MSIRVGVCFSKDLVGDNPLGHIGSKTPTYIRLLELIKEKGWEAFVLTRKNYSGNGVFMGGWRYENSKFNLTQEPLKIDLVYDRTGGVDFPLDDGLKVVNKREFKILCWDKWLGYKELGEYMPKTILVEKEADLVKAVRDVKTDLVVLKPTNGLKGIGIYVGPKSGALNFKFAQGYPRYIAQEFVDTSKGIPGITSGLHDLRCVVVNGQVVWSHIRVPKKGSFTANAAGGATLTEIDFQKSPQSVKEIVEKVTKLFLDEYANPIFSLDFGLDGKGKPFIFEINDQMGFPKWEMKNREAFLEALIKNFEMKLTSTSS